MRQLFSKADLRELSFLIAVVLLLAGAPSTAGFIMVSGPSQPEWTINVCQPLQTFNLTLNTLMPSPAPSAPKFVLCDMGREAPKAAVKRTEYREAPDTPPPKLV